MSKKKHSPKEKESHQSEHSHKTHHKKKSDEWYTKPTTWIIAILVIIVILLFMRDTSSGSTVVNTNANSFSADGKVVIEEFSDFLCPYCRSLSPEMEKVREHFGDSVDVQFKHFVIHSQAQKAHEASLCAEDQGKFWEYEKIIFANFGTTDVASLKQFADSLGLDQATFDACLDSGEKAAITQQHFAEARAKNVRGTPSLFINGVQYQGQRTFNGIKAEVERLLESGATATAPSAPSQPADVPALPDTSNDPEISLTIVNDANCGSLCDTTQIIAATKEQIFPTAIVTEVDISSEEGKALLEEYDINDLPAYIFDSSVSQAANFEQLNSQGAFEQVADSYKLAPVVTGASYFLSAPTISENDHMYGDPNAPITVVEYSDFLCSYCGGASGYNTAVVQSLQSRDPSYQAAIPELKKLADEGKVNIVYKHYLRTPQSRTPITAAECAADQGKFWEYHDVIFKNQQQVMSGLPADGYVQYAADLGLDAAAFEACLETKDVTDLVNAQLAEAQSFGITGTPGFLVNQYKLNGAVPFSQFQNIISVIEG